MNQRYRFRGKGMKKEPMELDITSLLDILVILLVFLLKSYSASDLKVNLVENLDLPVSSSQDLGNQAVILQINRNREIWINDKKLAGWNSNGDILPDVKERLLAIKEEKEKDLAARTPAEELERKKKDLGRINLLFDGELTYETMRLVMNTASRSGFPDFKFIVQVAQ